MEVENIVIIPSFINSKLSVYSRYERFEQTKKTILSIKQKIKNSFIVFIDISVLLDEEYTYLLNNCDLVINETDNEDLNNRVMSGKSYGEKSYIQYALLKLNDFNNSYDFCKFPNLKSIFKVGGRYYLNDNFNYDIYDCDMDVINIIPENLYKDACQSCLFKINKDNIKKFIQVLELNDKKVLYNNFDMEKLMFYYINNSDIKYKNIQVLGMTAIPTMNETLFDI